MENNNRTKMKTTMKHKNEKNNNRTTIIQLYDNEKTMKHTNETRQ